MKVIDLTDREIISKCNFLIEHNMTSSIVTLNSLMLKSLWHDPELASAVKRASLITADSVGICLASRVLDKRKVFRYPGIDMMKDLIGQGWRVFLMGGREGVSSCAADRLKEAYPHAKLCGTYHGYFKESDKDEVIRLINEAEPDILFIGLDTPRQEIWINENRGKINAKLIIGIGGSLDVISGSIKRAPGFWRLMGIEWLWRMFMEPWRLIRIVRLPGFMLEVLWRYLQKKPLID
ncbi:WecB/TagA/CpsF family glycosyltransferase [Elusimicrobiota bacterium]